MDITVKVKRVRLIRGRYFWQPTPAVKAMGFRAAALGADPVKAAELARALNAEVEAKRAGTLPDGRPVEGSVARLIQLYEADPRFTRLAPATRASYGPILREIEARAGRLPVAGIGRTGLRETYLALQARGLRTANKHMQIWRILLGHAWDMGWRADNPALGLRLVTPRPRRRLWSAEERDTFCAAAIAAGRPSLAHAVRLAHETVQRPWDVLAFRWSLWTGSAFTLAQSKTGVAVTVPVSPGLAATLRGMTRTSTHIIVSETTRQPYKPSHFNHEFARVRALAGLPADLLFRDLRRTGATELGQSGATDDELRSITGHQSRQQVATYVVPDGRMAQAGQRKRLGRLARPKNGDGTKV